MNLKEKINQGSLTLGAWLSIGDENIAEIFSNAGFDWVAIDLEHTSISISQTCKLIRVIELAGSSPLVRIPSIDESLIKKVMDSGAHGIIIPMVNSAEELRTAIRATRYPPNGTRGVGLYRAQKYGHDFNGYLDWQSKNPIIVSQIEHIKALDNLDEIFSEKDLDAFMIGPYDLSCSMGTPGKFDDKDFKNTIERINNKAAEYNIPQGIHIVEPNLDQLDKTIKEGYKFIAYSVDQRILDVASRQSLKIKQINL